MFAHTQQLLTRAIQASLSLIRGDTKLRRDFFEWTINVQMPLAFEVRRLIQPETRCEDLIVLIWQQGFDSCRLPDIELAFVSFGIGVQR